jgi:hypothetical protein
MNSSLLPLTTLQGRVPVPIGAAGERASQHAGRGDLRRDEHIVSDVPVVFTSCRRTGSRGAAEEPETNPLPHCAGEGDMARKPDG